MDYDPNLLYISAYDTMSSLNLSRQNLRSHVYNKRITTILVGGRPMFYRADVEEFAKKFGLPMPIRPEPAVHVPRPVNASYGMPGTNNVETIKETIQEHM